MSPVGRMVRNNPTSGDLYVPDVPSSYRSQLAANPTFYDNFAGTTLNSMWLPYYFNEGGNVVGVDTHAANIHVNNGLTLTLAGSTSGACIMSNGWTINQGYQQMIGILPGTGPTVNWGGLYSAVENEEVNVLNEIDVNETLLNGATGAPRAGLHEWNGSSYLNPYFVFPAGSWANSLHTYGALWNSTTVTFFYDGVNVGSSTAAYIGAGAPQHLVFIVEGNQTGTGSPTDVGASIFVSQFAYWPIV